MSRPAWAEINLEALKHNLGVVYKTAPGSKVMAVIKANAYGHGLVRVARALSDADAFGVASIDEAIQLRDAGIRQRIVLLEGLFEEQELQLAEQHKLDLVVHNQLQLNIIKNCKTTAGKFSVWLKVDTGMHRLGFKPEDIPVAMETLQQLEHVKSPVVLMTHLANADMADDEYTESQLKIFIATAGNIDKPDAMELSICNSGGVLIYPEAHESWVRPGIMLYGISPFPGRHGAELGLIPVMRLKSKLIEIKRVQKGEPVGYGGIWKCDKDTNIGVVAFGYGDGYPRHAVNGTPVLVNNKPAPLVGRVSMDMITVDLAGHDEASIGDEVELWGGDLPVESVAQSAETIAYELTCGITQRVSFVEK